MSTNLETGEGDTFSILGDDEGPSRVLVIQHSSGLADRQILVANVLDSGDDPDFGYRRDRVGRSREGNLKTTGGANGGLSVSADDCKTESKEGQREHNGAEESKGSSNWIEARCPTTPNTPSFLYICWNVRGSVTEVQTNPRGSIDQHEVVDGNRVCYLISDIVRPRRIVNITFTPTSPTTATCVSYTLVNESRTGRRRQKVDTDAGGIERVDSEPILPKVHRGHLWSSNAGPCEEERPEGRVPK